MNQDKETQITRNDFMTFFRDDESLNQLSVDDRIEVFSSILLGGCDFTKELLDKVFSDYEVDHLEVIEKIDYNQGIQTINSPNDGDLLELINLDGVPALRWVDIGELNSFNFSSDPRFGEELFYESQNSQLYLIKKEVQKAFSDPKQEIGDTVFCIEGLGIGYSNIRSLILSSTFN